MLIYELTYKKQDIINNKKLLGKRIKELRKNRGFTQEKLAEMIGLETTSLSGIESGRHFPSLPTLKKISLILDVEIKTLFDYNHLISIDQMKTKIIKNINRMDDNKIIFIHKFFEEFRS